MLTKFIDMLVQFPYRYSLKESGVADKEVEIKLSPGQIYEDGTKDKADYFNEIQKNCLYSVKGTRKLEGLDEIYDVTVPGLDTFGIFDIKLLLEVDADSTQAGSKIRVLGEKYTITTNNGNILAAALKVRNNYIVTLNVAKKTASIVNGSNDPLIDTYCPYWVGDILQTTALYDPASRWPGTKWELMEGFLRGAKSGEAPLTKGGKDKIILTVDQMPKHGHETTTSISEAGNHSHQIGASIHNSGGHNHTVDNHVHYIPGHKHISPKGERGAGGNDYGIARYIGMDTFEHHKWNGSVAQGYTSEAGAGNTHGSSPGTTRNGDHNHGISTSCATVGNHSHQIGVGVVENGKSGEISIIPGYTSIIVWRRIQ